jgi:NADPH:quinone reductase-like Zn-dependent oxidoreductase
MGADGIIFYRSEDVVVRVGELTGGRGVDLVLDHVGGPDFFSHLLALDKWGTVVLRRAVFRPDATLLHDGTARATRA